MNITKILSYIARLVTIDASNNLTFVGNLAIGSSSVNAGNVLQVSGNTNISGTTTISGPTTFNSSITIPGSAIFNNTTTFNGPTTIARAMSETKGTAVASASTTDIWSNADGNLLHVTGTTTITSLGTAPQAGAKHQVIFDGILTLTHNASTLVLPGATNATTAVGDVWEFIADTTTKIIGTPVSSSKLPAVDGSALTNMPQLTTQNSYSVDQTIAEATTPVLNIINTTAPGVATNTAGWISFYGVNSASVQKTFAQIWTYMPTVTAAAENGWLIFSTILAGTFDWRVAIGGGLFSQFATSGDKGVDTVNVKSYYVDGVQQYADTLQWTTVPATSDMSITSNATLANHTQLQIAVTSGVSYEVIFEFATSSPSGGIKVTLTGPTTSRCSGIQNTVGSAAGGTFANIASFPATITASTATYSITRGQVSFTASANGTFIAQFAQNTSNVTPTVIHKAAFLRYRIV